MLYTAAVMFCLMDKPHTYTNCQVINAHFKYSSEEQCWSAINGQIQYQEMNLRQLGYELIDAKCISWIPEEKKKRL